MFDLGGIPCDYNRIFEIVERKKGLFHPTNLIQKAIGHIVVIADAAHALGAKYCGKNVGSIADFTNFNFYAMKNFVMAAGRALTWKKIPGIDDEEIYRRAQRMSLFCQNDIYSNDKFTNWECDILGPWYKCTMIDLVAVMALAQLEFYPMIIARRKEIIETYDAAFKPFNIEVLKHYTNDYMGTGFLYVTRVFRSSGEPITSDDRISIIGKMAERGIRTGIHYKPFPMHTRFKELGFDIADFPNSIVKYQNEITLPLYARLTDKQVEYVIENYIDVLKEYI